MSPAEEYLKGGPAEVETFTARQMPRKNQCDNSSKNVSANIGLRVLAIFVFLALVFTGTYFARVSSRPCPILGFIIAGIGFELGRRIWRMSKQ